jgi:hypothetical protein
MSRKSVILIELSFDFHLDVICIYGVFIMVKGKACSGGAEVSRIGKRCWIVRGTDAAGAAGTTPGAGAAANSGVVDPAV